LQFIILVIVFFISKFVITINLKYKKMNSFILAGFLGPTEIIIILLVVVLLFGGRKIPELMKGLGQGLKEFKKATKDDDKTQAGNKHEEIETE